MKYFISQPMKDKSQETILAERKYITELLQHFDDSVEIVDSYFPHEDVADNSIKNKSLYLLGKAISKLAEADKMVMMNRALLNSKGCMVECMAAVNYKIPIIQQYDLEEKLYGEKKNESFDCSGCTE